MHAVFAFGRPGQEDHQESEAGLSYIVRHTISKQIKVGVGEGAGVEAGPSYWAGYPADEGGVV